MATLDLTGADHLLQLPTSLEVRSRVGQFAARFDYRKQGLAVVAYESSPGTWAVTTYPGVSTLVIGDGAVDGEDNQVSANYIYYGGREWDVTEAELVTALVAAGYTCA